MLILLDENLLSKKLKKLLLEAAHSVQNVEDMGWRGIKDQELLALTEAHPFDVFITADQNLPYQQSLRDRPFRIIVLAAKSTRPDCLLPLLTRACNVLPSLMPGSITLINDSGEIKPFPAP